MRGEKLKQNNNFVSYQKFVPNLKFRDYTYSDIVFLKYFFRNKLLFQKPFSLDEQIYRYFGIRKHVKTFYERLYCSSSYYSDPHKAIFISGLNKVFFPDFYMFTIFLDRKKLFMDKKIIRKPDYTFKNIYVQIGKENVIRNKFIRFFCIDVYEDNVTQILRPVKHKKRKNFPIFRFDSLFFIPFNYLFLCIWRVPKCYIDKEVSISAFMNYTPYQHIKPVLFTSNEITLKVISPAKIVKLSDKNVIHYDVVNDIQIVTKRNLDLKGTYLE